MITPVFYSQCNYATDQRRVSRGFVYNLERLLSQRKSFYCFMGINRHIRVELDMSLSFNNRKHLAKNQNLEGVPLRAGSVRKSKIRF